MYSCTNQQTGLLRISYVRYLLLIITFCALSHAKAQIINNTVSYRSMRYANYFRHDYENDFFTKTDKYYTQGINMEAVSPVLGKLPTKFLLLHARNSVVQYGLALQSNVYTPTSITDPAIRYGDRPYAASLMLQPFTISTDIVRKQRITTMLSLGVMGKIAGGEWMQTTIHRNLNNVLPEGWDYQIANDAVLNYRLFYEKRLLHVDKVFALNATALADVGTLQTLGGAGLNIMLGYFQSAYSGERNTKFSAYAYTHVQGYIVGYDAMLQGGLLNRSSMYTISAGDVERLFADNRFGVVLRYGGLYIEYFQGVQTRRFSTGNPHAWGGVMIGVGF